jgi:NADH dehydrogenase FAD-containing subunit
MAGGNKSLFSKVLDTLTHKLPESPKGASHYEVLVIGNGLGATFTKRFSHKTHGHATLCCVNKGGNANMNVNRFLYEQSRLKKTDYSVSSKLAICMSAAQSDGFVLDKYLPDENAVVLTNGRRIEYDHLVVATGMRNDYKTIPGFYEAWENLDMPVYSSVDHPNWKVFDIKYHKHLGNPSHGDHYFYIPPGDFRGEVAAYNFLASASQWNWYKTIGKLPSTARYYVVLGNENGFSQYDQATSDFFTAECAKRGVEIITGQSITGVDGANRTLTFTDQQTGAENVKDFGSLYAIPNASPAQALTDAGLASSETGGFLDVDQQTLRHNRYPNIFGLGDVNNLPTTKSWWGGVGQLHVAAHNVYRNLKGLPLNAKYDGYSKCPIYLDSNKLTYAVHNYAGPVSGNLSMAGGFPAIARYFFWQKALSAKNVPAIFTSKSNGPPKYKLGEPKWAELSAEDANKPNSMGYKVIRKDGAEPAHSH